jgi:hypothetical protein
MWVLVAMNLLEPISLYPIGSRMLFFHLFLGII